MITNTVYRFLVEKLGDANPSQFVGNEGETFYDPTIPTIKLSDGSTPGGISIAGAAGSGASTGNITFDEERIIGAANTDFSLGVIQLTPSLDDVGNANLFVTDGQYLNIYPTTGADAPHIHITAGTLGTESNYYSNITAGGINTFSYAPPTTIIGQANQTYTSVSSSSGGFGSYSTFNVTRNGVGTVNSVTLSDMGTGYEAGDILTLDGIDVGGTSGVDDITITVNSVYASENIYLKGDLFLGDDENYISISGNGVINLNSTSSSISMDSQVQMSASENFSITAVNNFTCESRTINLTSTGPAILRLDDTINEVFVGVVTFFAPFNTILFTNRSAGEPGIFMAVRDSVNSINTVGIFTDGIHVNQDYLLGKAAYGSVGVSTSALIYTSVGYGTHIGSLKLLIQGQGQNGGSQLSEVSIVREYQGNTVYLNETSRVSGIGSVTFTASYDSQNINVYADSSSDTTNDTWSFVICPTQIRQYSA